MTKRDAVVDLLDAETLALVDRLALARGISSDVFAVEAIRRVAEDEAEFAAFVQEGIDALNAGHVVSNDVVMRELDEMIRRHELR